MDMANCFNSLFSTMGTINIGKGTTLSNIDVGSNINESFNTKQKHYYSYPISEIEIMAIINNNGYNQ